MKQDNLDWLQSPIVVGGVGGSGTRLIADMLREMGIYMGTALNPSLDSLWFTLLLLRPKWVHSLGSDKTALYTALELFQAIHMSYRDLKASDYASIFNLALQRIVGDNYFKISRWHSATQTAWLLTTLFGRKPINSTDFLQWGWKEPNSMHFLSELKQTYPSMRYIHVIRHGVDMAYSNNDNQLHLWGKYYGISQESLARQKTVAQLEYWVRANQTAIASAKDLFGENFLLLNFDALCINPEKYLPELVDFLQIDKNKISLEKLMQMPVVPKSINRYKNEDCSVFSADLLQEVQKMGFEVECP